MGYFNKVQRDHAPLTSIKTNASPSGRQARWLDHLPIYTFEIEHKKGAVNLLADALSRLNIPECHQKTTYADQIINAVNIILNQEGQEMRLHERTNEEIEDKISSLERFNSLDFFVHALSYFEE